jgi:queuine tRNA-ribosyltransferase catalytic subunit
VSCIVLVHLTSIDGSEPIHTQNPMSDQSNSSPALRHEVLFRCTTTNARVSKLELPHYTCDTPMFMPVGTCGAVKGMTTEELEDLDCHLILGNTYHLALRPGTGRNL